jgi:hypothetical protein
MTSTAFKPSSEARSRASAGSRTTAPTVERTQPRTTPTTATAAAVDRRFEDDEADFQRRHRSARPGREPYAYYAPAYRYGYALATEPRYAGRDWSTIETEARRDWEARH